MAKSHSRGHAIYCVDGVNWFYADDDSPANVERSCVRCGRMPTADGYDACMGYVDGVVSACCGHGVSEPFVKNKRGWIGMEHISLSAIWNKASDDGRDVFVGYISGWLRNFDRSLDQKGKCEILLYFIDLWATTYKPHMTHYMREMNCYWVGDEYEK